MKKARKLITFILTVVMVLSMSMNVWADGEQTGTITITNAKSEASYTVYRILDLKTADGDASYSYTVSDKWSDFVELPTIKNVYLTTDANGNVTWVGDEGSARVEEFAKLALNYAKNTPIASDDHKTATGNTVTFDNLQYGYYLVDSSNGVLCTLDSFTDEITIEEKNEVPTIVKEVKVSADPDTWDEENTAFIGDTVDFKITITAQPGAQNYVLHDTMVNGLDFDSGSVKVKVDGNELTLTDDYTVSSSQQQQHCTFEIVFTETYLNSITTDNTIIEVYYSATLNDEATVGSVGNANTSYLEYGEYPDTDGDGTPDDTDDDDDNDGKDDNIDDDDDGDGTLDDTDEPSDKPSTTPSETTTFTYSFDLVKTDSADKLLDGATFKLYNDEKCEGEPITFSVNGSTYTYDTVSTTAEIAVTGGYVTISGLEPGIYYLKETDAPEGYNLLTDITPVTITDENVGATVTGDTWTNGGVKIVNNAGSELPSTGGIGTTIFYIVGGALVLFAVVLLVTKKRMKDAQ